MPIYYKGMSTISLAFRAGLVCRVEATRVGYTLGWRLAGLVCRVKVSRVGM